MRHHESPEGMPRPGGSHTQAVRVGGLVVTAGQRGHLTRTAVVTQP